MRLRRRRREQTADRGRADAERLDLAAVRERIAELCSFAGRVAGTDAERRAANRFASHLRASGRRAEVEPTYVHPQAAAVHALHCLLGFAGSLVAVFEPAAGFALVLAAATSMYLDLNGRLYLLRSLLFRRASQNVVSPGPAPDAPARLLLVAHLDVGRGGAVFAPRYRALLERAGRLLGVSAPRLVFWSLAALLPLLGARMAGVESDAISTLQLPSTLVLLVATFLLADIQLSDPSPGANDNASGVALALELARRLDAEPPRNLDVWVVLTGAQECGAEGMRAFVRSRRRQLDPATTLVLALDAVGRGDVRYVTREGPAVSFAMDRRMTELAAAIAEADAEGEARYRARPVRRASSSDAFAAAARGWRALALTCLEPGQTMPPGHHTAADVPGAIDPAAIERAGGFALELVAALDRDAGRTAPG